MSQNNFHDHAYYVDQWSQLTMDDFNNIAKTLKLPASDPYTRIICGITGVVQHIYPWLTLPYVTDTCTDGISSKVLQFQHKSLTFKVGVEITAHSGYIVTVSGDTCIYSYNTLRALRYEFHTCGIRNWTKFKTHHKSSCSESIPGAKLSDIFGLEIHV